MTEPLLELDAAGFGDWLARHHAAATGALVLIGKGGRGLSYADALDVALAWGWIDGHKRAHDERAFIQRFTPRAKKSRWSKINRDKAEALVVAGKMRPPGQAEIDRARADGRWDAAYDSSRVATIPDDLATALRASPRARALFDQLDAANRYAVLYRVQTASTARRASKIAALVGMLAAGETIHPRKKRPAKTPKKR